MLIENNLYCYYKLSQNTFLSVAFQISEEILGYHDVEDLISIGLTYKPIHKFIIKSEKLWQELYKNYHQDLISSIIKVKRKGNEEIEEEEYGRWCKW